MVRLVLLLSLLLPLVTLAQQSTVQATLDRSEIFFGETVKLRVQSTQAALGSGPDYRSLRQDFEVMSPSSNSQMTFSNGVRSVTTEWSVELAPLKTGTLTVPPLRLDGGAETQPITLVVKPAPTGTGADAEQDVYLEVRAEPETPYVQSQIRLVVKLFYARALTEGTLDEPQPEDAVVQKLGDDVTYQTVRGSRRYMVIERRYAIFPERSGSLVIPALRFRGRLTEEGANSRFGSVFNRGRAVTLSSEPVELAVRGRPDGYPGDYWLPARAVTLKDNWTDQLPQLRVGEPTTRTLTIEAQGLTETQLPESLLPEVDGMRGYPDQPVTSTRTEGVWKYAYREEKLALVPQVAGMVKLPAVRLHWWDTEADELRLAEIPAREVEVLPALAEAGTPLAPTQLPVVPSERTTIASGEPQTRWLWLALAALIGWALTAFGWWRDKNRQSPAKTTIAEQQRVDWRRHLEQACAQDEAGKASRALIAWARQERPDLNVHGLTVLFDQLDGDARTEIDRLNRSLYAPNSDAWSGANLWKAVGGGLPWQPVSELAAKPALPPLYPAAS